MMTVVYALAGIGAWTTLTSIVLYLSDRTGNSGRATHWRTNPRIRGAGDGAE